MKMFGAKAKKPISFERDRFFYIYMGYKQLKL